MSRHHLLIAVCLLLALPAAAQQLCQLQINVTCTSGSNSSTSCMSTTINSGSNLCTGTFFTGFVGSGTAKFSGVANSLGLGDCFDSSIIGVPTTQPFAFCEGNASLAPGQSFTASTTISGITGDIIGFSGLFDQAKPDSEYFVYAVANVNAPTCTPTVSSPPVTRSGLDYQVTWTAVSDPTAQYLVEESTAPDFSANLRQTQINGRSQTYRHDVSTTTTYFYRVRPTNCANGSPQVSAPTSTTVQAPPPATSRNPEATVPLGTTQPVSIQVFIPGSASGPTALADPTFTASTDKPYLTVTPSSGTIPPNGTTVTVTASPGSLPAGASTGTLRVTTNGTQTTNVPISINLVTPVAPAGKTTPPPNALIIPVVTHVNGAAGPFLSDVRLTNASSQEMKYQITMSPTRTDATTSSKVTVVTVGAQETTALNDIVKNFFGFGATGAPSDVGFGSLEIRPVNSSSVQTFASSRTYVSDARGTLGQYIAAIPFANFATKRAAVIPGPGVPARPITKLSLQHVAQSAKFRTNFGLAEGSGEPASGIIRIFDAAGTNLKEVPFSLLPGEQQQINGFISANGIPTLTDGRLEVEVTSATGAVTAYASVLDNVTTDPLAVTPVDVSSISSTRYAVPGVAELNNGASNFHSDVRIFNGGAADVVANLTFYPQQNPGGAISAPPMSIARGQMKVLDNILPSLFNVANGGGSVVITTSSPSSLVATARTYSNVENNGTFGQFIPGLTPAEGMANGDRALQLLQLEQSDRFRSNLGLVELTGNPATVTVSLYLPDSKITPSFDVPLAGNEFRQLGRVIEAFLGPGSQTYNARIAVQVTAGSGRVTAYSSIIDNQSFDPTYVPAQ